MFPIFLKGCLLYFWSSRSLYSNLYFTVSVYLQPQSRVRWGEVISFALRGMLILPHRPLSKQSFSWGWNTTVHPQSCLPRVAVSGPCFAPLSCGSAHTLRCVQYLGAAEAAVLTLIKWSLRWERGKVYWWGQCRGEKLTLKPETAKWCFYNNYTIFCYFSSSTIFLKYLVCRII